MTPSTHLVVDARMIHHSGIGTYIRNVVPRVADRLRGWQFTVLAPRGVSSDFMPRGRVRYCHSDIYTIGEQVELIRATPGDASLFWSPHYNIPLLSRTPLLVTIHDVAHLARPEGTGLRRTARLAYARTLLSAVRRRARGVAFVSEFSRREFERLVGPPTSAAVIHSGVDQAWFDIAHETPPHPRPYFVFVGNVKPNKNLVGLLRAFSEIRSTIPHDLVIIGATQGMRTPDSEALQAAPHDDPRIVFLGKVSDAVLREYVRHAAALVLPSFYEGFGLPPLEAMAAGCPVVASNIPAIAEVCGDAALYCDPGDPSSIARQLRLVVVDPATRRRCIERGSARARQFTWDRCADLTTGVVESAVRDLYSPRTRVISAL